MCWQRSYTNYSCILLNHHTTCASWQTVDSL